MKRENRQLIFENGRVFTGLGFGAACDSIGEAVFNTAMVGYQEMISDPGCYGQTICATYPLIGNYGLSDEDYESRIPRLSGLIVREYNDIPSNYRYTKTLGDVLEEYGVPGVEGIDTRQVTKMLRSEGAMRVLITGMNCTPEEGLRRLQGEPVPHDQVAKVSCKKLWYSRTANYRYNVVAVDCGIKYNSIRRLNQKGCNVTIVPYDTKAEDILALRPDGLFISSGPGAPEDVPQVASLVRSLQGKLPLLGISLGHLIIALANGGAAYLLKQGHHGGNHPVRNLQTGKVEITSQGHSYAIDSESLQGTPLTVTHVDLLDGTVEGLRSDAQKVLTVQYHPESAPGPQDSDYIFDQFIAMIESHCQERSNAHA